MSNGFNDFVTFRRMVTPIIIQILLWVGWAAIFVFGIVTMVRGGWSIPLGILIWIFAGVMWRVFCEQIILFFRMNESLTDIKNAIERKPPEVPRQEDSTK